jgi:hypothetical protein
MPKRNHHTANLLSTCSACELAKGTPLSERMQYADQIRNLINAVKDKAIAQGDARELDHWAAWAVEHADAIDPRAQSLESTKAWIQKFILT